jgi:transposase
MFRRGGRVRVVLARVVYKASERDASAPAASRPDTSVAASPHEEVCVSSSDSKSTGSVAGAARCSTAPSVCAPAVKRSQESAAFRIVTAPMPKELFPRGLLAPSMIAHILFEKYVMGVPFYRQEQQSEVEGFRITRATMCRYAEDAGATLGAIVEAARNEALASAFCLSTDATGIAIQPTPLEDGKGKRQPCRKGHFFVTLADRDHVFFDYQTKHTSAAVWEMFKGFSGYVQADAHAVYDALFRGTPPKGLEHGAKRAPPPTEVGCWSHYPGSIVIRDAFPIAA